MGILIDSSVLIEAERGHLDLDRRLASAGEEPMAISSITASELLHGVHRARTPSQRTRRDQFVGWVLEEFPIFDFGLSEARTHAMLWADLRSRGLLVEAHDLIIGATALTVDFGVATANLRDFRRIRDLVVLDWSS